jgi:hypothetical protein
MPPVRDVPPVIDAMRSGARSFFPKSSTEVSSASSETSGSDWWTSVTSSRRFVRSLNATRSVAQSSTWSSFRAPMSSWAPFVIAEDMGARF